MAALSDSVITKEGLNPKFRFKVAVLTVITHLPWLKENDFLLTPIDSFSLKIKEILSEAKEISVFHKLILLRQPDQYTQFELQSLKWIFVLGFQFFKFCSAETQINFIRRANYKTYGPGRWILKEGHLPKNMYMIVKGYVKITETIRNHVFNTLETNELCILGEKRSFGKSAVMFNSRRLTSVQSLDTVELISISKNDFVEITKNNLKLQWDTNVLAIKNLSYFKHLSLMELNKCSVVSCIKTFKKYERVFGERTGYHDYGYFVIEGEISLIFRKLIEKVDNQNPSTKSTITHRNKRYKYVDTCTFFSDSYFNIGENMVDKEFVVNENAKCLCVPHWFMKITEKLKKWTFAKLDLEQIIPNVDDVFNSS